MYAILLEKHDPTSERVFLNSETVLQVKLPSCVFVEPQSSAHIRVSISLILNENDFCAVR